MLNDLFDFKFKDGMKINVSKNEIYNQMLLYMFFAWKKSVVIVTPTLNEANQLYRDLQYYLKESVYIFPDDLVGFLICIGEITRNLLSLNLQIQKGKRDKIVQIIRF